MSAPFKFDLEAAKPLGKDTPTPGDLAITPRDRRFGRENKPDRWWLNGDPVATAWHNGLSVSFPIGEVFFIEHVKAHRDSAPPTLESEIRAFTRQEVNHAREHAAFNRAVTDAGYDVSGIERRLAGKLSITKERSSTVNLAATMALEHLTAVMARHILEHPGHYENASGETGPLWRWHMAEEIEHKGVAYDTWLYATREGQISDDVGRRAQFRVRTDRRCAGSDGTGRAHRLEMETAPGALPRGLSRRAAPGRSGGLQLLPAGLPSLEAR
jgi:predicted metal-dependent hydrolase